ncbi:MAG TPA: transposase [Thermoleophilaceae bacterium]|nr:transposase [Thermoleophilaceae bacterium]
MPRPPRTESPGGIHHVWQRGNNKQLIFSDAHDRRMFLRLLQEVGRKYRWECLGYCLLDNHFHLILETVETTLGAGMRALDSRYAHWFNERHDRVGHLFQARFGSKLVTTDEQFAQLLRYVARNPVRAGACDDPGAWQWSSHRALMTNVAHPLVAVSRVTELLSPYGGEPGRRYPRLFEGRGPLQHLDPDGSPWEIRPTLLEIFASEEDQLAAMRRARQHDYRLAEIAAHAGVTESTVCRRLKRV